MLYYQCLAEGQEIDWIYLIKKKKTIDWIYALEYKSISMRISNGHEAGDMA